MLLNLDSKTGIRHMIEDKDHNLILFSESNCHQIITVDSNQKTRVISVPSSFDKNDCLQKFWLNSNNEANFLSTSGKIIVLNDHKLDYVKSNNESHQKNDIVISTDCKRAFKIINGGLLEMTSQESKRLLDSHAIPEPEGVQRVSIDAHENIWIAHSIYNTLLYIKSGNDYSKPYPILEETQANICFDRSNNTWLCSSTGGLIKIPLNCLNEINLFFNSHLMVENVLSSYCQKDGTIWLGYANGHVSRFKGGEIKHIDLNKGTRKYNRVLDIGEDGSGNLYFILDEGGCRIKQNNTGAIKIEYYRDSIRNTRSGKGIFYHQGNKVLFGFSHDFGGFPDQLSIRNDTTFSKFKERRFSHFITKEGRLLMSTVQGLISMDRNGIKRLSEENELLNCRINKFAQYKNGDVLLATHGKGFIILRNDQIFQHFETEEGLGGFICRNIHLLNDTIWLSTNSGITALRYLNNQYEIIKNINTSDGLISDDVNSLFILQSQLYASTSKGLSVLNLNKSYGYGSSHPKVIMQSFSINGIDTVPTEPLILPSADYHFKVNYITPNLYQDYQLVYRYKLLPNDTSWTLTKSNSLEFVKLNAGNYSLHIQSKLKKDDWSEPTIFSFQILPPFYRTWWFYLAASIFLAVITYFSTRFVIRRKYIKALNLARTNEAIQNERNRIAADLHDDIGADLTNLVILSRLFKKDQKKENVLASKIEHISHELISKMNEVIWALNPLNDKLEDLVSYVLYYAKTATEHHEIDLEFNTHIPPKSTLILSAEQRRNIFLVIKEFINNTLKHSKASKLGINISVQQTTICVVLFDTGSGSSDSLTSEMGNGISNMNKRIESCGGTSNFGNNLPKGIKFTFTMPLIRK